MFLSCPIIGPVPFSAPDAELAQGGGSIQNVLKSVRVKVLSPTPAEARQLVNVNTPEDWERVRDYWAAGDGCRVRGNPKTDKASAQAPGERRSPGWVNRKGWTNRCEQLQGKPPIERNQQ